MLKISGYIFAAIGMVLIGLKIYQSEIPGETSAVSQQENTSLPGVAPAFPGLSGPQETTILPGAPSPTSIDRYGSGGPGHLSLPQALPQMLVATGYRYSSSITANEALTHLPYQLMHDRGYNAEVSAYEFPVTIEDEQGSLADRLDDSINLARKIGRYGGVVNVLIHTDIAGEKLRFEQQFVEQLRLEAWFADMGSFGDWWAIRDNTSLSVVEETNGIKTLEISTGGVIDGLTLQVPASWQYTSGLEGTVQDDNRVVMGQVDDQASLRFEVLKGR